MQKNNTQKIPTNELNASIIPRGSNVCSTCNRTSIILYGDNCELCLRKKGVWKE